MGGPGSGGHNKLSAAERRARGTFRGDRDTPERPRVGESASTPPEWLSAEAKLVWERVAPMFSGAMSALDAEQLANYAEAQVLAVATAKRLRREGLMVKRAGGLVPNPLVKMARDCRAQALAFAKSLGLGLANGAVDPAELDEEAAAARAETEAFLFGPKPPLPQPRPVLAPVATPAPTTPSQVEPSPAAGELTN